MAIKDRTFEKEVFKELDLVWKTYLNKGVGIKKIGVRRERSPKLIHIYGGEEFFKALENSLDSNPLMRIILDNIGKSDYRYFPIYTRNRKGYRAKKRDDWGPETFYDRVNHVWDYAGNKIDFGLDVVVGGYPPILTWLFVERPHNTRHGDLLIYFIRKRYASKEINTSETINGGTETESSGSSEECDEDSMTIDSESDISDSAESDIK